jgi:hypothetical protein
MDSHGNLADGKLLFGLLVRTVRSTVLERHDGAF